MWVWVWVWVWVTLVGGWESAVYTMKLSWRNEWIQEKRTASRGHVKEVCNLGVWVLVQTLP